MDNMPKADNLLITSGWQRDFFENEAENILKISQLPKNVDIPKKA